MKWNYESMQRMRWQIDPLVKPKITIKLNKIKSKYVISIPNIQINERTLHDTYGAYTHHTLFSLLAILILYAVFFSNQSLQCYLNIFFSFNPFKLRLKKWFFCMTIISIFLSINIIKYTYSDWHSTKCQSVTFK